MPNLEKEAREAVVDLIMQEQGLSEHDNLNLLVTVHHVDYLRGDSGDWRAIVSTDAHTDRNYTVTHRAAAGRTDVETFVQSQRISTWAKKDSPAEVPPEVRDGNPATAEYYGSE